MKKTSYVIIAVVAVFFVLGLGLAAYTSATAKPLFPNPERVEEEFPDGEADTDYAIPADSVAVDSID